MNITGFTSWHYENDNDNLIEPNYERMKLWNKNKKYPTPDELTSLAKEHNMTREEYYEVWKEEYDKLPTYTNENEAKKWSLIEKECYDVVKEYFIKNKLWCSDDYHQNGSYGVPIVDNKYIIQLSLRTWSGLMAEVWNEIENTTKYNYLDFYCSNEDLKPNGSILLEEFYEKIK